jgi:hypothetical protein
MNGISSRTFRDFITRQIGTSAWVETGFDCHQAKLLEIALGEIRMAEKVSNESFFKVTNRICCSYLDPVECQESAFLLVCPICIELGYHSLLHEIPLISSCPFHGCLLIRQNCERSGIGSKFDRKVMMLIELLNARNDIWFLSKDNQVFFHSNEFVSNCGEYFNWLKNLHLRSRIADEGTIPLGDSRSVEMRIFLSMANWVHPMPSFLINLMGRALISPDIVALPLDNIQNVLRLNQCVKLKEIVRFCCKAERLGGGKTRAQQKIEAELRSHGHVRKNCKCNWRFDPSDNCWYYVNDVDSLRRNMPCPFDVSKRFLADEWYVLYPSGSKVLKIFDFDRKYNGITEKLVSMSTIEVVLEEVDSSAHFSIGPAKVRWLDKTLHRDIEIISATLACRQIADARRWQAEFALSQHPVGIDGALSVQNIHFESNSMSMVGWPVF